MNGCDSLDRSAGDRIARAGLRAMNQAQQQGVSFRRSKVLQFPSIGSSSLLGKIANQGRSNILQFRSYVGQRLEPLEMIDTLLQMLA
jgi:hypothetical protein